ncbi:hypothetical protein KCU91_g2749, partial [Aureobasidium melanogenum]
MPELNEVSYSREATIAAFRDYYQFLTEMFLPENRVEEPPAEGWSSITKEKLRLLDKDDEVVELMRHLPYISNDGLLAPHAEIAHWPSLLDASAYDQRPFDESDVEETRVITDGLDWENVPSSAFGISCGDDIFILDTQFGVVFWLDSPGEVLESAAREPITDDFYDCTPENEHEWRSNKAWAIPDFFEVLKNRYRILKYLPFHERRIEEWFDIYKEGDGPNGGRPILRSVRKIYQEQGWPDLSVYKKNECLDKIDKTIKDHFPAEDF